jgi:hypothetical protein
MINKNLITQNFVKEYNLTAPINIININNRA